MIGSLAIRIACQSVQRRLVYSYGVRRRAAMLTIRQAQFAVLSQLEVRKFEDWMLVHLKKFFPRQCAVAGDTRLREMVQHGIERAAGYGVTARRDVCKYVDLMIVFGRDFDTDSRTAEMLAQRRNPGVKMQTLLRAAKVRLGRR
jgi:hypothetical protein